MQVGEVWFARFPFEDDKTKHKHRPVIVLDVEKIRVLSVKVTTKEPRDDYDVPILYWEHAKLRLKSTARVSKTIYLDNSDFEFKIGNLHEDDFNLIQTKFVDYVLNESE